MFLRHLLARLTLDALPESRPDHLPTGHRFPHPQSRGDAASALTVVPPAVSNQVPLQSPSKLVQLFERNLRDLDEQTPSGPDAKKKHRVNRDLDEQIVAFAAQVKERGNTPEQML